MATTNKKIIHESPFTQEQAAVSREKRKQEKMNFQPSAKKTQFPL